MVGREEKVEVRAKVVSMGQRMDKVPRPLLLRIARISAVSAGSTPTCAPSPTQAQQTILDR